MRFEPKRLSDVEPTALYRRIEAAEFLRCQPRKISELIEIGMLPASRIGREYRIHGSDILAFAGASIGRTGNRSETHRQRDQRGEAALSRFT